MGNPIGEYAFYFNNLRVERPPFGVQGDYNGNSVVDAPDYVVWRKSDSSLGGYDIWRMNFGRTAASSPMTAVPEPTGAMLGCIASPFLFMRRRRAANHLARE
jgi:hypothetical protein